MGTLYTQSWKRTGGLYEKGEWGQSEVLDAPSEALQDVRIDTCGRVSLLPHYPWSRGHHHKRELLASI